MHDPLADMFTRLRNAQQARHLTVAMPASKMKAKVLDVMKEEGYITGYHQHQSDGHPEIVVELKYHQERPVIESIKRISRPGLRIYKNAKRLPRVSAFGVAILTTSQGIMTHQTAKKRKIGGEVICEIS